MSVELKSKKDIKVKESDCIGCGCCILYCPLDAINASISFVPEIDEQKCNHCLICIDVCPQHAIKEE